MLGNSVQEFLMSGNRESLLLQNVDRNRDHCLLIDKHFRVSITYVLNPGVLCNANFECFNKVSLSLP
jgi:hypothetical protein